MNRLPLLIIILLLAAGAFYGYLSAANNTNPDPIERMEGERIPQARIDAGKAWQPSPVWLPSYLVATVWKDSRTIKHGPLAGRQINSVGYGMTNVDGRGYAISNAMQRGKYQTASIAVGAVMGLLLAIILMLATGMVTLRKRRHA